MRLNILPPFILIISVTNTRGISVPCNETYIAENGRRCYPCSEGYYKVSDCVQDGEQARCRPCGRGEFMPTCDNANNCKVCDPFCNVNGQVVVEKCTPTSNLKCECIDGQHWIPHPNQPNIGRCAKHNKCIPGEGLKRKGTPFEDTLCEPCIHGVTYSNSTSMDACLACSFCNVTQINCSVIKDAVCGSILEVTPNIHKNADDNKPWVVALIVALVAVVTACIVGVFLYKRRRQNQDQDESVTSVNAPQSSSSEVAEFTSDDTRCPDVTGPHPNGINGRGYDKSGTSLIRNAEREYPTPDTNSVNKARNDDIQETSEGNEHQHTESDCCINMTQENLGTNAKTDNTDFDQERILETRSGDDATNMTVAERLKHGQTEPVKDTNDDRSTRQSNADKEKRPSVNSDNERFEKDQRLQNVHDDISKNVDNIANGTECLDGNREEVDEAVNGISIDAGGVPSRYVQPVSSSPQSFHNETIKTIDEETVNTTETEYCPTQEARSSTLSDDDEQNCSGTRRAETDKDWYEVINFLSEHFAWDNFKQFYRRLMVETSGHQLSQVDAYIENTNHECSTVKETMYKLMTKWREHNPKGTTENIMKALEKCKEKRISEDLEGFMNKLNFTIESERHSDIDTGKEADETQSNGERSTAVKIVDNKDTIERHVQQSVNNLQMQLLKQ